MNLRRVLALAALALLPLQPGHAADPERGRLIATRGVGTGAVPCAVCHGADGQGKLGLDAPRLGGQLENYLFEELRDFASGRRQSVFMNPIARTLSEAEMADVAAYYARQHPPYLPQMPVPEELRRRGAMLALLGSRDGRVQACSDCHGPLGLGEAPLMPYITGQPSGYMEQALEAFRSGQRSNDPYRLMQHVASGLSDSDIQAVVAYFTSLRPPRPDLFGLEEMSRAPSG